MEEFVYQPKGTCSTKMVFQIDGDTIQDLKVTGGCPGNLKGISALMKGMKIEDVINRLDGVKCGLKPTSCPDQMAQALKAYLQKRGA